MLNCVYVPSYSFVYYFVEYNISRMFCVKLKLIVIEDSCCKQVSLPRFVSGQGRTSLRVKGNQRRAEEELRLHNGVVAAGKKTYVQNSIVSVTLTPKQRGFISLEAPIRREITGDFTRPGIGDSNSGPQRYKGQDRRTIAMLI